MGDGRDRVAGRGVESVLNRWLVPYFGDRALDAITPEDVVDLMRRMEVAGVGRRANRPVGPKSIRNYIGTLSAMLNFAQRKGWATRNAASFGDLPAVPTSEDIRFLDPDEVSPRSRAQRSLGPTRRSTAPYSRRPR